MRGIGGVGGRLNWCIVHAVGDNSIGEARSFQWPIVPSRSETCPSDQDFTKNSGSNSGTVAEFNERTPYVARVSAARPEGLEPPTSSSVGRRSPLNPLLCMGLETLDVLHSTGSAEFPAQKLGGG